jgi:hypothetical protein
MCVIMLLNMYSIEASRLVSKETMDERATNSYPVPNLSPVSVDDRLWVDLELRGYAGGM